MAERRNDMGIHRGLDEYERLLLTASLAIILLGSGMLAGCLVITTRLHGVNTTDKIIFWVVAVIMMLSMPLPIASVAWICFKSYINRGNLARVADLPDAHQAV
jgi:hypothetical protein